MWDYLQQPPFLFPSLRKRISCHCDGKPFNIFGANSLRDFQSASAVAQQLIKLSQANLSGVFNVASGKPMTVAKFACDIVPEKVLDVVNCGDSNTIIADTSKLNNSLRT